MSETGSRQYHIFRLEKILLLITECFLVLERNGALEMHDEQSTKEDLFSDQHKTISDSLSEDSISELTKGARKNTAAKLYLRTRTIAGTLLVFLVSMTLLIFVISSDVRAARRTSSPLVGFQHGKDTRSTMDIVYSCLSTMIISSISSIHFDIPRAGTSARDNPLTFPTNKRKKMLLSVIFWAAGLLMPEIIVIIACMDYQRALLDLDLVGSRCPQWTLKHSFFAKMGGFEVDGAIVKDGREIVNIPHVNWERIGRDISDKSKKDVLSKSIAVIQIGRFLLAMIARAAASLPISPLEYFTCAQVVCALLVYIFWFDKPHNVQEPIRISTDGSAKKYAHHAEEELEILNKFPCSTIRFFVAGYAAVLVGASALGQWNSQFSTPTSEVLWRTFSIVSALLPLLTVVLTWTVIEVSMAANLKVMQTSLLLLSFFHFLNRFVLVGLVFHSVSSLPADVYRTVDWLNFVAFIQ